MAMPKWFGPALAISAVLVVFSGMKAHASPGLDTIRIMPGHTYRFRATATGVTADDVAKLRAALTLAGMTDVTVSGGSSGEAEVYYTGKAIASITYTIGESYTVAGYSFTLDGIDEVY